MNLRYLVILVIVLVLSGEQASGPRELTQEVEWAGDRGGDEGDAPAVHDGYKRKIVREADACKKPAAVGALLRREELYFFHLTT